MGTSQAYRLKAEELERTADALPAGPDRDQYADIARQWRILEASAEASERKARAGGPSHDRS
jgi:hypothetical protein